MSLIADGLMIVAGLTAGLYCLVLSRRLRQLSDSGQGIGAQIRQLSDAIAETRGAVAEARKTSAESGARLGREMKKAEGLIAELRKAAEEAASARPPAKATPRDQDFLKETEPAPVPEEEDDADDGARRRRESRFATEFDDMDDLADIDIDPDAGDDAARGGRAGELNDHGPEISSLVDAVEADLRDARVEDEDESGGGDGGDGDGDDAGDEPPVPAAALRDPSVLHVDRVAL